MSNGGLLCPPNWSEYVEHCGGEKEAQMRVLDLIHMDLNGPVGDQIMDVDVSHSLDSDCVKSVREEARQAIAEGNAHPWQHQANLLIGKIPIDEDGDG